MGKLTRKCKTIADADAAVVKTRPRSLTMAEPEAKRRKTKNSTTTTAPEASNSELNSDNSARSSGSESCSAPGSHVCYISQTSSNGSGSRSRSSEIVNESTRSGIDPEDTHAEFESSPYTDSMGELESDSAAQQSEVNSGKSTVEKPTAEEIQDFFAFFDKNREEETKKLSEKYNFDFVNDKPLEGRYEWIPMQP